MITLLLRRIYRRYGKGYTYISTYKINEFRDGIYDVAMENLSEIYKVEALGMWGVTGELVPGMELMDCIAEPKGNGNKI